MSAVNCYVCGRVLGSLIERDGHTVCVDVAACTERVMNPPPEPQSPCPCQNASYPEWCAGSVFDTEARCWFGKPTKAEWDRQHSVWFEGV